MENRFKNTIELRRQDEEAIAFEGALPSKHPPALSPEELRKELHKLRVHQIHLEMQNEELRDALRKSEEEFRILFTHPSVGLANADPVTGRFLRANAAFCRLAGYPEQELLQRTILEVTHPEDRELEQANFNALIERKISSFQSAKRYLRTDGTIVWVHVTVSMVHDAAGRALHTMAVVQDITEFKQAEEALKQSEQNSKEAKKLLELVLDTIPVRLFWRI